MMRGVKAVLQAIGLLAVLIGAALSVLIPSLTRVLQVEDTPERASQIVVLAGDYARIIKAAELYRDGFSQSIFVSKEQFRPSRVHALSAELGYPNLAPIEFRVRLLRHLGVKDEAISIFGENSTSTVDEANALSRRLPDANGTMILVTSPYHSRRARLIFSQIMPNVRWLVVSPPEGRLADAWWTDQKSAREALIEFGKLLYHFVRPAPVIAQSN